MKVIVDLCVVPIGVGVSLSTYIAECERILKAAGLKTKLHAYGTNIEGEWDAVFDAIRACHERLHAMGAPRISTTIKLGTRVDRAQTMEDKIASVEAKLKAGKGTRRPRRRAAPAKTPRSGRTPGARRRRK